MIRRLIILLLIVGCVFGDTIKYKIGDKNKTLKRVEYIGVTEDGIVYGKSWLFFGNTYHYINCNNVYQILDRNNIEINFSCSNYIDNSELPQLAKREYEKSGYIGGIIIAMGGWTLWYQNENPPETFDVDAWEKHSDDVSIGYVLIIIGGILVAAGI